MDTLSISAVGIRWGAVLAAAMIVYGLGFRAARLDYRSLWGWGFYVMPPLAAVAAQLWLGRAADDLSFGAGLALAAVVTIVGSSAYGIFVFLYNRFVDDSLIRTVVADRVQQLEVSVAAPEKRARSIARVRSLGRAAPFAALVTLQLVVVSLVVAAVATLFTT